MELKSVTSGGAHDRTTVGLGDYPPAPDDFIRDSDREANTTMLLRDNFIRLYIGVYGLDEISFHIEYELRIIKYKILEFLPGYL